ncbi:diacylglycerol/lipid kinase family protein [Flavobacteriaceae bacterium LMO-SS05]
MNNTLTHIHFIVNPIAGSGKNEIHLDLLHQFFEPEQYTVIIKYSEYPKHATTLTLDSINEGATIIVACGGDGTINEVARCLVNSKVALGIMAMGSGNGLASNLNIPRNINKALLLLKNQNIRKIDVGRLNDNYFFSNAGLGIAANVVKHYEKSRKRKLFSYLKASLRSLSELKEDNLIQVTAENQTVLLNPLMLFISNSNQLGYKVSLTPKASLQDGLLDIILVRKTSRFRTLLFGLLILFKKHQILQEVKSFQTNKAKLSRQNKNYFHSQIDGEYFTVNEKSISISVLEKSLCVIA